MEDTPNEPTIIQKKPDSGFIKHVFKMDNDSKHNMLNTGQYLALAAIPLGFLFHFIDSFIPKPDESKSNAEILIEIFGQTALILIAVYLIDKVITYIPTYSGKNYDGITDRQYRLTIIGLGILILVPKIINKFKIVFHRISNSWNGEETDSKQEQKQQNKNTQIKITQPITGLNQPIPTKQPLAKPDYQSQHNVMTAPQNLPVINSVAQQAQQPVVNNTGMMMQDPIAANDGFGAFSSF
tara:strand:- start:252 stop:968 length:717 start_codon:yes stop_codon:yes gene_type:complete